jgi:glycine cleavage system H protein
LYPRDLRYSRQHEWLRVEGDQGIVGITAFAQDQLGDVVYVELPKTGSKVEQGKTFGVVESVKTASDLYSPVSGTIVGVNEALADRPELVNQHPYGEGWMIAVAMSVPDEVNQLLSADQYEAILPR